MDEHKKFLADRLLSEERPITYRLLSRALEVHVNTAKRILYDFHQYQNALRAGSVHATYLLYGVKSVKGQYENCKDGMSSSMPEPKTDSEAMSTHTLTLVREEDLKALLREYQDVVSIHVYSLAPRPQIDVAILADVASSTSEIYKQQQGPLHVTNKYGAITNPSVRRRDPAGCLAPPAASAPKLVKQEKVAEKPAPTAIAKPETTRESSANATTSSSSGKGTAPAMKRGGAGGIMQSFAKAASKPPSKPKQAAKQEDTSAAALSDDGEADDSDIPSSKNLSTKASDATRKSRKEREENLKRMMDESDGDDMDWKDDEPDDEEMDDAPEAEPEAEPEPEKKTKQEPSEAVSSSGDGRRRGKRRIMKKKRILDDQGYMVTIQEPGWESFSEDDTLQPPAKKATPTSTPSSSGASAAKAKKPGGRKDQGNIMSFFSKK